MISIASKVISLLTFIIVLSSCEPQKKLPFLGHADVIQWKKNGHNYSDTIYPIIPNFHFLNQDSNRVNKYTYSDKIWIVEFFFTSCPTICPIMNQQLQRLYKKIDAAHQKEMQWISFSIDPNHDGPSILKKYQKEHGLFHKNWDFLTGNEEETHRLGIEHFLTFAGKDEESAGGYAHSGSFTLVDRKGHVRGVYAITNFDMSVNEQEFDRMVNEINILYDEHIESQ
ncbi:MAG: hypothetical protein RLZ10_1581 [Bacteroidota bacterium]|jgi:protein SCO1/2